MDKGRRPFSMGYHKFMVNFAMWVIGIGMILVAARNIWYADMDALGPMWLIVAVQIILAACGVVIIKARFDLAKMLEIGVRESLIACLVAAVAAFVNWRIWVDQGSLFEKSFLNAVLAACWGIGIYRYYKMYDDMLQY